MSRQNSINSNLISGPFYISTKENPDSPITPKICQWNIKENMKFFVFLKHYREIIQQHCTLRRWTAYKLMSKFVVTKNFTQCRNHHMKLKKQHQNVEDIQNYLATQHSNFDELFQKYNSELQKFIQTRQKTEQELNASDLKTNTSKQHDQKTTNNFYKEPKKNTTGKQISKTSSFVMSQCHSMPDFYFKLFYPQLVPTTDNQVFFYGQESIEFEHFC